jgi:hypothetical protein
MRGWLSRGFLIGGTFAFVWLIVIYNWRSNNRMPNAAEVALYFIAVPVGLLISFWLLGKTRELATSKAENSAPSATNSALNEQGQIVNHTAEHERSLSIAILASAIRTVHGSSAEELSTNLKSNESRLNLDTELADSKGYPISAGRIKKIDENAQLGALSEWAIANNRAEIVWTSEQLRAISLGSEIVTELAQQATKHNQLEIYNATQPNRRDTITLPAMQLIALLPENWEPEKYNYAIDWFSHLVQQQGWPAEKTVLRYEPQASLAQAFTTIDRLMLDTFRQSQPCFSLVLSCESNIGAATMEKWELDGKLSSGQGNVALVPGEGAAGLLLADEQQTNSMIIEPKARLHRVVQNRRDKSVDSKGVISDQLLTKMVQDALAISNVSAEKISLVSSDTDHRSSRMTELMGMGFAVFPELDNDTQYFKITGNCGTMGSVAGLTSLALGHHEIISDSGPAICISNLDSYERTVAVVNPWIDTAALQVTNI